MREPGPWQFSAEHGGCTGIGEDRASEGCQYLCGGSRSGTYWIPTADGRYRGGCTVADALT